MTRTMNRKSGLFCPNHSVATQPCASKRASLGGSVAGGQVGRLDIGCIGARSDGRIPRLSRRFRPRFPDADATLHALRPAPEVDNGQRATGLAAAGRPAQSATLANLHSHFFC